MSQKTPKAVYLKDYKKTDYTIPEIQLHFDILEDNTRVKSFLKVKRSEHAAHGTPLALNGEIPHVLPEHLVFSLFDWSQGASGL